MFVVSVPIFNLRSFSNECFGDVGEEDIVSAVAINYPTIKRLCLYDYYDSSATLLKFVENCREIEEMSFADWSGPGDVELKRSDIEAIASLPRLKSLNIDCWIENDDAVSILSRCRGLRHLDLWPGSFALNDILPNIGRNLVSLDYNSSTSIMETVDSIVEHCPNLQMLSLGWFESDDNKAAAVDALNRGLKRLSKLKLNHKSVRLGTDWVGY
jgi:hypothetical protein